MVGEIWGSGVGLAIAGLRQKFREMQRLEVDMISMNQPGFVKTVSEPSIYYSDGNAIGITDGVIRELSDNGAENQLRSLSASAKSAATLEKLNSAYEEAFGKMGGANAFISSGNKIAVAINTLCSMGGDNTANKLAVLQAIQLHTKQINTVSNALQNIRNSASNDIANQIPIVNQILQDIANINKSIEASEGSSGTSYLRQRRALLDQLSGYMEIQVSEINSDFLVYTPKGRVLVEKDLAAMFIYNPPAQVSASATFGPGTILLQSVSTDPTAETNIPDPGDPSFYVNRRQEALIFDISADFNDASQNGSLSGALNFLQGDSVLFAQQLDSYAAGMRDSFNSIHNLSSAIKPRTTLQGSSGYIGGNNLTGALAITAAGTLRVSIVNTNSNLATLNADIDISSATTVTELCNLINNNGTLNGHIAASVNATTNSLEITTADVGCGISLGSIFGVAAPTISTNPGSTAYGLSEFFHLNDLFTPASNYWRDGPIAGLASSLSINPSMLANPQYFSVNKLRDDATGVGIIAQAVSGDPSIGRSLSDLFVRSKTSFATLTGGTTLQTLEEFSKGLIQQVATKASAARTEKEAQEEALKQQKALFTQNFGMDEQEIAIRSMQISKSQDLYFSFINNYWRMMSKVAEMGAHG
jgi:flagellar hook-associated protein FlgK